MIVFRYTVACSQCDEFIVTISLWRVHCLSGWQVHCDKFTVWRVQRVHSVMSSPCDKFTVLVAMSVTSSLWRVHRVTSSLCWWRGLWRVHCDKFTVWRVHSSPLLSRQLEMIRPTLLPNFAGPGHQSQRRYPCSAHCPPATALVTTLQVGKMRVVARTSHCMILPVVTSTPRIPTGPHFTYNLKRVILKADRKTAQPHKQDDRTLCRHAVAVGCAVVLRPHTMQTTRLHRQFCNFKCLFGVCSIVCGPGM